jgi:hypothetical protein
MTLVFSVAGPVDIELAGAPLPVCPPDEAEVGCGPSAAEILWPADAEVRYATLAWAASGPGPDWGAATLVAPDGSPHPVESASETELLQGSQLTAEVTEVVAAGGPGEWSLHDVSRAIDATGFAGWALTVVYEAPGLPDRRANVYQGRLRVSAGTGKALEVDAPTGTADQLGFVVWGASSDKTGSDVWMSSGSGQEEVSQELIPNPFQGKADGYTGAPTPGTDVFTLESGVVFPKANNATSAVTLNVRAWGDTDQSDPFTLGGLTLLTDLPQD